jgi:DMSO/TMAO reductase YedYZ molybdopterin-dependent catalytic subunit
MAALRALSDAVILVKAADGYQTAVSAAAAAMDSKGERYLLALSRDGKPLDSRVGPVRLIVPGDPKHVRWVRAVTSLRLVRLDPAK